MILELIQAIENEDERQAITEIFNLYYGKMKAIAFDILHNREDTEDAAMNAIKYMCDHPQMFIDYSTSHRTINLIYLCVKSAAIDIYRSNKRKNKIFSSLDAIETFVRVDNDSRFDDAILNLIINDETKAALAKVIDELDEMYKIPILLKYYHQMRNIEIAEMMHLDVNMVNARIFRAKKILQQKMKALGYTE